MNFVSNGGEVNGTGEGLSPKLICEVIVDGMWIEGLNEAIGNNHELFYKPAELVDAESKTTKFESALDARDRAMLKSLPLATRYLVAAKLSFNEATRFALETYTPALVTTPLAKPNDYIDKIKDLLDLSDDGWYTSRSLACQAVMYVKPEQEERGVFITGDGRFVCLSAFLHFFAGKSDKRFNGYREGWRNDQTLKLMALDDAANINSLNRALLKNELGITEAEIELAVQVRKQRDDFQAKQK